MKKQNKRGFQLSLNMIIMIVIALVFLGIAIALIQNWGNLIGEKVPAIIPPGEALWPPTTEKPIILQPSEIDLNRGSDKTVSLEVFNYVTNDITCTLNIVPVEEDEVYLDFLYPKTNRAIEVGMVGHWDIHVTAKNSVEPKPYMFTVNADCEEFKKEIDLIVNLK